MKNEACEQCSICPEEFQYADMYEKINVFVYPLNKKIFVDSLTMTKPRIKVLQFMYGTQEYFLWSEWINRRYCERHGYDYVVRYDEPRKDRHGVFVRRQVLFHFTVYSADLPLVFLVCSDTICTWLSQHRIRQKRQWNADR